MNPLCPRAAGLGPGVLVLRHQGSEPGTGIESMFRISVARQKVAGRALHLPGDSVDFPLVPNSHPVSLKKRLLSDTYEDTVGRRNSCWLSDDRITGSGRLVELATAGPVTSPVELWLATCAHATHLPRGLPSLSLFTVGHLGALHQARPLGSFRLQCPPGLTGLQSHPF